MSNQINRYSDEALEEFRTIIQQRLDKANEQLELLQSQIFEITESSEDDFGTDWVDDSHTNTDMEMLNDMAIRQRKYIQDLENALIRIKNHTYGVCQVTGELIDKKRLMAVPTTTKSIAAKKALQQQPHTEPGDEIPSPIKSQSAPKIIEKVIRKGGAKSNLDPEKEEEELLRSLGLDTDDLDDDNFNDAPPLIDPDSIADPDSDDF